VQTLGGGLLVASSLRIDTAIRVDDFLQPIDLGGPVRVLNVLLSTTDRELVHRQLRLYGRELFERFHACGCDGVAGKKTAPTIPHDRLMILCTHGCSGLFFAITIREIGISRRGPRAPGETRRSTTLGTECSGKRVSKLRQVPLLKRHYAAFLF